MNCCRRQVLKYYVNISQNVPRKIKNNVRINNFIDKVQIW